MPLDAEGRVYASLGGEFRERAEVINRMSFGIGGHGGDSYLLQRAMLHMDLHLGSAVRVFSQLGAEKAFGKQVLKPPDEDQLDVQQLFVEVKPVQQLAVRVGRQEIAFNASQRFVNWRDGTNVRQNFDGIRATLSLGRLKLDGFAMQPVTLRRGVLDNTGNDQQAFAGIYGALALDDRRSATLEGYWLHLRREDASFGAVTGEEQRHSLGLRTGGTAGRWDWDLEGMVQRGSFAGQDIEAWAFSADVGYTVPTAWKPRFGLRFDSGSGDRRPGDGKLGTFNPLFPKGAYFNEANLTSFANLVPLRTSVRAHPVRNLSVEAALQWKWKEQRSDAVYMGASAPLAGTQQGPGQIGQAYSVDATLQLGRHWKFLGSYLHHTTGPAIKAAGGEPVHFGMASIQYRF